MKMRNPEVKSPLISPLPVVVLLAHCFMLKYMLKNQKAKHILGKRKVRSAISENLRIVSVIGARPQFIKAALVSQAIESYNQRRNKRKITHIVIHTGQHYDYAMSQAFF